MAFDYAQAGKVADMPNKRVITQYSGSLSPAQAAIGIETAMKNASALASDALLLLQNRCWPRAAAMAILAIAEAGKPSILRAILLARNEKELREEWKRYRSHSMKNVMWILPDLVRNGARHLEDLRPLFDENGDHGQVLVSPPTCQPQQRIRQQPWPSHQRD